MSDTPRLTELLNAVCTGHPGADQALLPIVYDQLKRIAARRMAGERREHTLTPTALVHEAYLRLLGPETQWSHRRHFYSAAAQAMRRILIEHARQRAADKRGGDWVPITLDPDLADSGDSPDALLCIDQLLEQIRTRDPEMADVVTLRYFGGFSTSEVARILEVSERTVIRRWVAARAWIGSRLEE